MQKNFRYPANMFSHDSLLQTFGNDNKLSFLSLNQEHTRVGSSVYLNHGRSFAEPFLTTSSPHCCEPEVVSIYYCSHLGKFEYHICIDA